MTRDFVLGTAGHIDHGKTSLVKALTGIDCDRFPEEKARGITIDIGFAHWELDGFRLGIVDVPGHERFIRNMLAGATGIDLGLLVIAADDSVMPQTREHLDILQTLGIQHGVIALTKADLVDETTREVVALEIRELVRGSFLESAPIVATSARTGLGLAELKAALQATCEARVATQGAGELGIFRMAIDRSFSVPGHGTVVTGTVTSGQLRVGDEVAWLPSGEQLRVRGLQNHDQAVAAVSRGMRAAVNLAGVKHDDVIRGQELATPGFLTPSRVLSVSLTALPGYARPIKHRANVRVHMGTAEIMGTVALLEADVLAPGQTGLAQLFLEEPAVGVWGQPLVLRSPSATSTVGGGKVIQPHAEKIRRRHDATLAHLRLLAEGSPQTRVSSLAWFAGFRGLTASGLVRAAGVTETQATELLAGLHADAAVVPVQMGAHRRQFVAKERLDELNARIVTALQRLHEQTPLLSTHDRQKLESGFGYVGEPALVNAMVEELISQGTLVGDSRRVALATHRPKLSAAQRKLKDKIVEEFTAGGFQPPELKQFAGAAGGMSAVRELLNVCVLEGLLVWITDDLLLASAAEQEMRQKVRERLSEGAGLTVADIRDLLGTTRKYAVPLCEYLDRIGVTRRDGDLRYAAAAVGAAHA